MLIHTASGLIVIWSNKLSLYLNSYDLKWNVYVKITGAHHMFLRHLNFWDQNELVFWRSYLNNYFICISQSINVFFFQTNQSICVYNMSSRGNYLLPNMPLWAREANKRSTQSSEDSCCNFHHLRVICVLFSQILYLRKHTWATN